MSNALSPSDDEFDLVVFTTIENGLQQCAESLTAVGASYVDLDTSRSLDGTSAQWVLSAVVGREIIRGIKDVIIAYLDLRSVTLIRIGSIEIRNPTKEQIDELIGKPSTD